MGHEDQFRPPSLNGRCRFGQATFTETHGNERAGPLPALRRDRDRAARFDPSSHSPVLLDHLVGAGEDRWRYRQPQQVRRFQADDQLECGRLLDRQVGGLCALENVAVYSLRPPPC